MYIIYYIAKQGLLMKKILLLIFSLSLSIQAAYNPFFTAPTPKEEPAKAPLTPTSKPVYKKVIVKPPVPKTKNQSPILWVFRDC